MGTTCGCMSKTSHVQNNIKQAPKFSPQRKVKSKIQPKKEEITEKIEKVASNSKIKRHKATERVIVPKLSSNVRLKLERHLKEKEIEKSQSKKKVKSPVKMKHTSKNSKKKKILKMSIEESSLESVESNKMSLLVHSVKKNLSTVKSDNSNPVLNKHIRLPSISSNALLNLGSKNVVRGNSLNEEDGDIYSMSKDFNFPKRKGAMSQSQILNVNQSTNHSVYQKKSTFANPRNTSQERMTNQRIFSLKSSFKDRDSFAKKSSSSKFIERSSQNTIKDKNSASVSNKSKSRKNTMDNRSELGLENLSVKAQINDGVGQTKSPSKFMNPPKARQPKRRTSRAIVMDSSNYFYGQIGTKIQSNSRNISQRQSIALGRGRPGMKNNMNPFTYISQEKLGSQININRHTPTSRDKHFIKWKDSTSSSSSETDSDSVPKIQFEKPKRRIFPQRKSLIFSKPNSIQTTFVQRGRPIGTGTQFMRVHSSSSTLSSNSSEMSNVNLQIPSGLERNSEMNYPTLMISSAQKDPMPISNTEQTLPFMHSQTMGVGNAQQQRQSIHINQIRSQQVVLTNTTTIKNRRKITNPRTPVVLKHRGVANQTLNRDGYMKMMSSPDSSSDESSYIEDNEMLSVNKSNMPSKSKISNNRSNLRKNSKIKDINTPSKSPYKKLHNQRMPSSFAKLIGSKKIALGGRSTFLKYYGKGKKDSSRDQQKPKRKHIFEKKGDVIDGYKFIKVQGKGSFGRVVKAESMRDQRLYAIKEIDIGKLRVEFRRRVNEMGSKTKDIVNEMINDCINNEVEILKQLFIDGGSLLTKRFWKTYKRSFKLSQSQITRDDSYKEINPASDFCPLKMKWDHVRHLFRQFTAAIKFMAKSIVHSKHIVHHDLKPDNVMVNEQFEVKVIDLGVSKQIKTEKPEGKDGAIKKESDMKKNVIEWSGTLMYKPPEQISSDFDIEGPSVFKKDIWSMGVILYEILFGVKPFYAQKYSELCDFIQNIEPNYPDYIPENLKELLVGMLQKCPTNRYTIEQESDWITSNEPMLLQKIKLVGK